MCEARNERYLPYAGYERADPDDFYDEDGAKSATFFEKFFECF